MRTRIALEAAGRLSRGSFRDRWAAFTWNRRPELLSALAAVLVALMALPLVFRGRAVSPAREDVATVIAVQLDGQAVKLAWSDGRRGAYKVYKSNDPRTMARAEVHVVKGNVWTDSDPGSSPAVFYRIE